MIPEFQNLIQMVILCCLAVLGLGRAIVLKTQKTEVFVLDSQMTKTQLINGLFFIICFLIWILECFFYGFSFHYHFPLAIFDKLIIQHIGFKFSGVIILVCGLFIYAMALYSLRDSWRVGIDREKPGKLVTTGMFKYSRNPIYVSLNLLIFGTFLLQGRFIFLILFICIAASLHIQILQEEKFLIQTYGEAFIHYRSKVSRYFNIMSLVRYRDRNAHH